MSQNRPLLLLDQGDEEDFFKVTVAQQHNLSSIMGHQVSKVLNLSGIKRRSI